MKLNAILQVSLVNEFDEYFVTGAFLDRLELDAYIPSLLWNKPAIGYLISISRDLVG